MSLADNPAYKLEAEIDGHKLFTPVNIADGYHTSRYVEALNQQIYANAGATREVLQSTLEDIILRCNKQFDKETFRTDVAALTNSLLYRLKYPVDQHCAIRLGTVLTFLEYSDNEGKTYSESPEKVDLFWQQKKESLALNNPAAYAFFLQLGVSNLELYKAQSDILSDSDYFLRREREIAAMIPQQQL